MRNITKSGIIGLAVLTVGLIGTDTVEAGGKNGRKSGRGHYGHTYNSSAGGRNSQGRQSRYKQSRSDYQSSDKYQQKNRKQYKRSDADNSGKISGDEFRGSDKRFDRIDKNDDGEIGKKEYKRNKYKQKNRKQYKTADADSSGKISSDEFRGSDERFDRIDKNDDGEIGKKEYKKNKYQQKNKKQYKTADADGSGKISGDEFRGSDERFDRIDKNDDGEIGKKEYKHSKNHKKNSEENANYSQDSDSDSDDGGYDYDYDSE